MAKKKIASKVNPANWEWPASDTTPADEAFSAAHVIARTEESLRNLGADAIDVQQFHVWSDAWVGVFRSASVLARIRHFVVCFSA